MDIKRIERLKQNYSSVAQSSRKKEINVMNRGASRNQALQSGGKPKDLLKTIKRLYKYLSNEKFLFILALLCALIFTATSLASSYLLRPIINKFLSIEYDGDEFMRLKLFMQALIILGVVYIVSVVTQWLQTRIMLTVSQRSLQRLRDDLYKKLQNLPISFFDNNPTGDIMSRFTNDIDSLGDMLNTTLIQIISGSITIVGTIILMLVTNWILGLITIVMTPILTIISKTIIKRGRKAYTLQQRNLGMLNGYVEEIISGQKVIKIFNHEDICKEEFDYINDELTKAQIKAQFNSGIMGPCTHQLCNVSYALTACVGGILMVLKGFDVGGIQVSLNFTRHFNRPINDISTQMHTIFASLAGAERVFEIMDLDEEYQDNELLKPSINGNISINNVNFGYLKDKNVLFDISLNAYKGEKIAFVGSTGAGKTTITNLLSKFYNINSGNILIDGNNINDIDTKYLRENIATVLQDTHLFHGTIMENIRYGRLDATDEEVIEACKVACAHNFITQLENGYDTILSNDGANLSQGQRQLLNIARASISKAPILILDEATSSVDTKTEKDIEAGMDALMENRTTFVIAHRLSTVRRSNKIMVLEKGKIVESGNHDELLKLNGRYHDLYNEIVELD